MELSMLRVRKFITSTVLTLQLQEPFVFAKRVTRKPADTNDVHTATHPSHETTSPKLHPIDCRTLPSYFRHATPLVPSVQALSALPETHSAL